MTHESRTLDFNVKILGGFGCFQSPERVIGCRFITWVSVSHIPSSTQWKKQCLTPLYMSGVVVVVVVVVVVPGWLVGCCLSSPVQPSSCSDPRRCYLCKRDEIQIEFTQASGISV